MTDRSRLLRLEFYLRGARKDGPRYASPEALERAGFVHDDRPVDRFLARRVIALLLAEKRP